MDPAHLLDGRLKLRHLVLVDALTAHGSVVAAAARLHSTQPALTRTLRELEDILGVSLYERGPRGVVPTIYGVAFTGHARAVLAQVNQAAEHLAELADAWRGIVTVGSHLAGSNLLLPAAVARFKTQRPGVTVAIREASPEALNTELEAGRLDLIVGRLTGVPDRGRTVRHVLYREPVRLVARRDHPAWDLPALSLPGLIDFPWILPGPETALRGELEEVFLAHDLALPQNRIECTSILTMRYLLARTDVIAALPQLIAAGDPQVALLPISLDPMSQLVGATLAADRPPNPSAEAFLEDLRSVAADLRRSLAEPEN
jgi:DNA-binding transcriptional LysR family regulator